MAHFLKIGGRKVYLTTTRLKSRFPSFEIAGTQKPAHLPKSVATKNNISYSPDN